MTREGWRASRVTIFEEVKGVKEPQPTAVDEELKIQDRGGLGAILNWGMFS